jgi:hypothetical protein
MSNITGHTDNRCAAFGCENERGEGRFAGDFCRPCDMAFRTGKAEHGTSFVFKQQAALRHIAIEPLTDDPEASDRKCLDEAVRIAAEALSNEEQSHG